MMKNFFAGKKILITGHTGFKGSWLCRMLLNLDADVYGYALEPPTDPNMFEIIGLEECMTSCIGDITDYDRLLGFYGDVSPDIVIHMAAQPIVREGYRRPRETYESNVMGTVNVLECARQIGSQRSIVNVTTDKVYENLDIDKHYVESDRLDGFDPYSNSKSCSELVTRSYKRSFLDGMGCAVSTARAGNVIGGGDFASERIVPDCVRAAMKKEKIIVRNPNSVRPYQHVLEPLFSYLMISMRQWLDMSVAGSYNIGPDKDDCITTGTLTETFCRCWGDGLGWEAINDNGPHEANYLKLDNSLMKTRFGVAPLLHIDDAIEKVVEWTKSWMDGKDMASVTDMEIEGYLKGRGFDV